MAIKMADNWNSQEDLAEAIDAGALELYYQPKFEIATRRPAAPKRAAALEQHEARAGFAGVFVPLATEIGMMQELTRFVFMAGIRNAAEWPISNSGLTRGDQAASACGDCGHIVQRGLALGSV